MSKSIHLHRRNILFCHTMRAWPPIMVLFCYFDQSTLIVAVWVRLLASDAFDKVRFWAWVFFLASWMQATILSWELLINIRGRLWAWPMNCFYLILVLRSWPYRVCFSMLVVCWNSKVTTARTVPTCTAALTLHPTEFIAIRETCTSFKILH